MSVVSWWFPPPSQPAESGSGASSLDHLHSPLMVAAQLLAPTVSTGATRLDHLHSPLMMAADLLDVPIVKKGGAGKFAGLSRGMRVIDQEAWEEEGVILPLMLDDFP